MKNKDKLNQRCNKCKHGTYVELSIYDDLDGKVTCNLCSDRVVRHEETTSNGYHQNYYRD